MLLWAIFFLAGLAPEWTFDTMRELALVSTQKALVNSRFLVTLGLAAYFAMFTFHRCRETSMPVVDAYGKALQMGVLALFAFLPVALEKGSSYQDILVPALRWTFLSLATAKYIVWLFLLSIVFRYYFMDGHRVFERFIRVYSDTRTAGKESEDATTERMPAAPVHNAVAGENPRNPREAPH